MDRPMMVMRILAGVRGMKDGTQSTTPSTTSLLFLSKSIARSTSSHSFLDFFLPCTISRLSRFAQSFVERVRDPRDDGICIDRRFKAARGALESRRYTDSFLLATVERIGRKG